MSIEMSKNIYGHVSKVREVDMLKIELNYTIIQTLNFVSVFNNIQEGELSWRMFFNIYRFPCFIFLKLWKIIEIIPHSKKMTYLHGVFIMK